MRCGAKPSKSESLALCLTIRPHVQAAWAYEPHARSYDGWSAGFYFGKIALTEVPVASMVLFRFVFACAGLLPVIFFHRPHFAGSEWAWVLAASVLGVPVQHLVPFKGLSLTSFYRFAKNVRFREPSQNEHCYRL
jgi:hypothetical protein